MDYYSLKIKVNIRKEFPVDILVLLLKTHRIESVLTKGTVGNAE